MKAIKNPIEKRRLDPRCVLCAKPIKNGQGYYSLAVARRFADHRSFRYSGAADLHARCINRTIKRLFYAAPLVAEK